MNILVGSIAYTELIKVKCFFTCADNNEKAILHKEKNNKNHIILIIPWF